MFEKLYKTRACHCFNEHNILYNRQFGFRKGHNTTDTILHFVDDVVTALDRWLYTVTIFLDFSKAFDTVNKTIMLRKLDRYGFRDDMNDFLNSYLSDRKMYVSVNGSDSTVKVVSHYQSFQHSEWQIEGQTHFWRANWRAKWGSHWHSPLQFFSALCPPYTLHQSLLWSHTGRLYAALKMSPDEKSAERNTSHQSRLDVNWMAASVSALPAKRFTSVIGLHSIAAGTCPLPLNVRL